MEECHFFGLATCDETLFDLCITVMEEEGLYVPISPEDSVILYQQLRYHVLKFDMVSVLPSIKLFASEEFARYNPPIAL